MKCVIVLHYSIVTAIILLALTIYQCVKSHTNDDSYRQQLSKEKNILDQSS